jgi:O-6-methylguanine DNA methyltransferase
MCVASNDALIGFLTCEHKSSLAVYLKNIEQQLGVQAKQELSKTDKYKDKLLKPSKRTLNIDLVGTPFQLSVWRALLTIENGQTCSYQDIAKRVGKPKGARAVGGAVGQNPICYLVPCHRVITQNGKIGGYSGGLAVKRKMLLHEGFDQFLK